MPANRIYLDNHSTTRVDPRVMKAMLPYMTDLFGNPGSTHLFGEEARDAIGAARDTIANCIGATGPELVFTSGATESNNLAIRGVVAKYASDGNHIVTLATEHPAVLGPIDRLRRSGCEVTIVPVSQQAAGSHGSAGVVDLGQLEQALRDDTVLVSVMLANNEIGTIQPIAEVASICRRRGALLHCDATQAVGKLHVDVNELDVDLMSFSAHKIYGPRGVGALYVRRRPRVRLEAQIDGGGQQLGRRSGTLNTPGIVGFGKALELCDAERESETERIADLRGHLWERLSNDIPQTRLNGPDWSSESAGGNTNDLTRLPGNLNVQFEGVDAESLMIRLPEVAVSTGSACTAEKPEPSHVLLAIGLSEDDTRSSIRFGIGRFNTRDEIDETVDRIKPAVSDLRSFR